jgi:hypothetical protein
MIAARRRAEELLAAVRQAHVILRQTRCRTPDREPAALRPVTFVALRPEMPR